MRKPIGMLLIAVVWLGVLSFGVTTAQDKTALKLGEFTTGTITDQVYEVSYSFSGKKGDVITLEILRDPKAPDLDPTIELRDSQGQSLAHNDDFAYPLALVVAELPADGDYVAVAGRADGQYGKTVGDYSLRVNVVTLIDRGTNIDAKVSSDVDAPPQIYILHPTKDMPLEVNFRQNIGDHYASLSVLKWLPDNYPDTVVNLDGTARLNRALLFLNLEADHFYVFLLQQTSESMSDPVDFPVTIGLI